MNHDQTPSSFRHFQSAQTLLLFLPLLLTVPTIISSAFIIQIPHHQRPSYLLPSPSTKRFSSSFSSSSSPRQEEENDKDLLSNVTLEQLQTLCRQYNLPINDDTKPELLKKLRTHAASIAELERSRRRRLLIENNDPDTTTTTKDEDDEGTFYYAAPPSKTDNNKTTPKQQTTTQVTKETIEPQNLPPPNEAGERVVTIYSSTDRNDLTATANVPFQSSNSQNSLLQGSGESAFSDDVGSTQTPFRSKSTKTAEFNRHVEICTELIETLLSTTGAPAYRDDDIDIDIVDDNVSYPGFDPNTISSELLTASLPSLLHDRGQALRDTLSEFELQSIGHDGMAADDISNGGGHYREVQKIKVFLEGYRLAQVRNKARESVTMLLNALVREGVDGLDAILRSGVGSSSGGEEGGDWLNDDLMEYLNESVRNQETRVRLSSERPQSGDKDSMMDVEAMSRNGKNVAENVSVEQGEMVETIDLKDESALQQQENDLFVLNPPPNDNSRNGAEQLLYLLTLLRERIKAEAAFKDDKTGRGTNLKLLAYCLKARNDVEREAVIWNHVGGSLDRLDSFYELLNDSIDYAESTSHQLSPSRNVPLDVDLLKHIQRQVGDMKTRQAFQASGGTMSSPWQ